MTTPAALLLAAVAASAQAPAPRLPAAVSIAPAEYEADDATPLVALPPGARIRFTTLVTLPPGEFTPIVGDRGFYVWRDGALTRADRPYDPVYGDRSFRKPQAPRGSFCWMTFWYLRYSGPRPLNGHRELRFRGRPQPWLGDEDIIVVGDFLKDPESVRQRGPFVEAVFCSKGGPAGEFTVGDLRQALGRERTRVMVRVGR